MPSAKSVKSADSGLNTKPGSSTAKQHSRLVILGKRRGFELAEIRKMVGGSIRRLSAAEASDWIERFGGGELPNPPGQAPPPERRRTQPGVTRMITPDQIAQIGRLGLEYFANDVTRFLDWFGRNYKPEVMSTDAAAVIRQLGTAERAGQVIAVITRMLARG